MKHASSFSLLFLTMMIWFLIETSSPNSIAATQLNNVISSTYTPIIIWVTFFGYLLFPSKRKFNGRGR